MQSWRDSSRLNMREIERERERERESKWSSSSQKPPRNENLRRKINLRCWFYQLVGNNISFSSNFLFGHPCDYPCWHRVQTINLIFSTSLSTRYPPVRPFLPLISAPTGFHNWGLVTRWAQLLITLLTAIYPAHRKVEVWWETLNLMYFVLSPNISPLTWHTGIWISPIWGTFCDCLQIALMSKFKSWPLPLVRVGTHSFAHTTALPGHL